MCSSHEMFLKSIGIDGMQDECDDDDDNCEKAPHCPPPKEPTCPAHQQGEGSCLSCTSCFAKTAAPGTVSVKSYLMHTLDGQDMRSLTLKVSSCIIYNVGSLDHDVPSGLECCND